MSEILVNNDIIEPEDRDDILFERLVQKRKIQYQSLLNNKEQARAETREIPLQLLALEWFNKIDASIETRAYLVENFLPILVLGCEKILKDAQKKDLVDQNQKDVNFNPVNLLGQYLMRNNPKYNNSNETSAYVRTMREVYGELREQMFAFQENKLAKVKADIRQRRTDRESVQKSRQTEINRRTSKLEFIFSKWHIASNGRIEIAVLIESLQMYSEHIVQMPQDTRKSMETNLSTLPAYCSTRDGLNLTKRLLLHEFVQSVLAVTDNLSSEFFDLFIEFMQEVTRYFVLKANKMRLNKILRRLFQLIDSTDTGLLTRRRLVNLFNDFTQSSQVDPEFKMLLRDPMEWPLLDPIIKFENKLDAKPRSVQPEEIKNEENIEEVSVENNGNENLEDLVADEVKTEINPELSEIKNTEVVQNEEEKVESKDENIENTENTENTENAEEIPDIDQEKPEIEDENKYKDENKSGDDSDDADKPKEQKKELKIEENLVNSNVYDDESEDEDLYVPVKTIIAKNNELLFLNGGILYYKPLEEELNAFDTGLIQEQKNPRTLSAALRNRTQNANNSKNENNKNSQLIFDTEFLDVKQFQNLFSTFLEPEVLHSEKTINDLIVLIKDNYSESQKEKNAKMEKIAFEKKYLAQRERFANCFEKLDNEGSCCLSIEYLGENLFSFKEGLFKEQTQESIDLLKSKIKVNGRIDDIVYKDEFINLIMDLVKRIDFLKFEDQIMNYLNGLVMPTRQVKERGDIRKYWLKQIEKVGEVTFGSFEPLYKQLFETILKDSETHGNNVTVSAYVGILETIGNEIVLKYNASTPYDSKYVLGKCLNRNTENNSFNVIDEGKMLHIEKVRNNNTQNIHFFNKLNQNDGSLIIYPLKYSRNKIFGTLSIDSLQEKVKENQSFTPTQISFYQGVSTTFAKCYASIVFKNRMAKIIEYAFEWLNRRSEVFESGQVHVVQSLNNETKLKPVVSDDDTLNGNNTNKLNLKAIKKFRFGGGSEGLVDCMGDNENYQFKAHKQTSSCLYECALTSETTTDTFNSRISHCFPLRDEKLKTLFVIELISKDLPNISKVVSKELDLMETLIYVLNICQKELLAEYFLGLSNNKYAFETQFEQEKFEILFEKQYLNIITDRLNKSINSTEEKLIELLPDGTQSPETSKTQNLFKLIGDLISNKDFAQNPIINELLIDKLRNFDSTVDGFKFKASQSNYQMVNDQISKDLHLLYSELGQINSTIRYLVDWSCLQKDLKLKVDKIKESLNKNKI